MSTIALKRQFLEWKAGKPSDLDLVFRFGRQSGLLDWEAVSARRRVVILAEAGSGKTTEMREQARIRTAAGQIAFYATVQDVARDGLVSALSTEDQARLASWLKSGESGWFFIDSVDEAKLHGFRLERVIRRIADGISGGERRAHVILSGRVTDWEFRSDLEQLNKDLPIPRDQTLPPPPTAAELLMSTLRNERQRGASPPAEEALVVLVAPLDSQRVRQFAAAKGVPNLDDFLRQIEAADLWRFARRPLDLDWLVDFWRTRGRLGSLAEMLQNSLTQRIRETNPDRSRGDGLDGTRALRALERTGAALILERKSTIAIPDSEMVFSNEDKPLDLTGALPDWSSEDRMTLLARPVFDPATFGRARLHNDNNGVVRSYLAAHWLDRLRQTNLSQRELYGLLFATTYGIEVIKPSMQETAAWLALRDPDIAREVCRRDPMLLLTAGDPASLSQHVREAALAACVERLTVGDRRLPILDLDSLKRFARSDLADAIRGHWSKYHEHDAVRSLLLRLIWIGAIKGCADLVEACAFEPNFDRHTRILAGRALAAVGDENAKRQYAKLVKENCTAWPNILVWDAIDGLFPGLLGVDDLLSILAAIGVTETDGGLGFKWRSPGLVDRLNARKDLERLLSGLLDQLGDDTCAIGRLPDEREEAYLAAIAAAACRLLESCSPDEAPNDAIDAALELGTRRRYSNSTTRFVTLTPSFENRGRGEGSHFGGRLHD